MTSLAGIYTSIAKSDKKSMTFHWTKRNRRDDWWVLPVGELNGLGADKNLVIYRRKQETTVKKMEPYSWLMWGLSQGQYLEISNKTYQSLVKNRLSADILNLLQDHLKKRSLAAGYLNNSNRSR